ncbi:universal stress protein [Niveibacterium sp. 24ML]|uniref:universal stress protein n=1 Tax=Niveibacterium sp. 24ML TaxID=2985512 RepID=UPI002270E555|nr:universal stress protein [Niveibacterium sp. 24ML]MCX9157031.1 universal stress protein [Niveibacterium sp. 24ML]
MKILLASDGSAASLAAVDALIRASRAFAQAPEIVLVTVHNAVPMTFATRHIETSALDRYYSEEGCIALAPAASRLKAAGLEFEQQVLVGMPAETIVAFASDRGCDWIWLGARGHNVIEKMLLGTVAARVVQLAHCPVMVAR